MSSPADFRPALCTRFSRSPWLSPDTSSNWSYSCWFPGKWSHCPLFSVSALAFLKSLSSHPAQKRLLIPDSHVYSGLCSQHGTREPGGLPSMGSHRVRHDWSDLAAAAAAALSIPASLLPPSPSPYKMRRRGIQVMGWEENHVFQGKRLQLPQCCFLPLSL